MKTLTHRLLSLAVSGLVLSVNRAVPAASSPVGSAADPLEAGFRVPPPSARPWVYWFPLDGNITSNGITADLEAMRRVGIGGVLYMETDQGAPSGPAEFAGPLWRSLFQHLCAEAERLGLEVNMNNDAGWCGSGGPWITPELSMQRVVWAETPVTGPRRFEGVLPLPQAIRGFYRDIALFAFPTPSSNYTIAQLAGKSALTTQEIPLRASYPTLPPDATVARDRIVNLTGQMRPDGRLDWTVPAGDWTLLRMGHTTTGKDNHPAPLAGRGLECDKLSKAGAEAAFAGLMAKLIADSKPRVGIGKTLVSTHIDSWEVGSQNWTPKFREEFQRLRGYDPLPYLPVIAGRVVGSLEVSERFLWDVRMTVSDLLVENYAGHFAELARRNGLRLSIEAYGEPADDLTYAGRADEPMAEFWSWSRFGAAYSCTAMASAAHVYGKPILGAEAFTATDAEKWLGHPGNIKDLGDWAFCEGINRFVFHRYALQPWTHPDRPPGMSMGPWGLHYERTQTWWEQSRAWHEYLARCQFLLQQGRFVADLCFLAPETSPQAFKSPVKSGYDRPGYNFDGCPPEVVLTRMRVEAGRLVLPDGMSYRLLVLPQVETMTPRLLRKLKELVTQGATVVGAPPRKSPSLSGYPQCDEEVRQLALELWGAEESPAEFAERSFGKGRILWGGDLTPKRTSTPEEQNPFGAAHWIWRAEGQPAAAAPPARRFFRRTFEVGAGNPVTAARLALTADNSFACWVNGRLAGSGDDWNRAYDLDITDHLQAGVNVIAVAALNGTSSPNPAGLIARLHLEHQDGRTVEVLTDNRWLVSEQVTGDWTIDAAPAGNWTAAMDLGELGMAPWGEVPSSGRAPDPIPEVNLLVRLLERQGVPPDFTFQTRSPSGGLRYLHRVLDGADIYFVANKNPEPEDALCTFRVSNRRPELWWPDTGRIERPAVYDQANGIGVKVPIHLDPHGSVFVVFRTDTPIEPDRVVSVTRNGETLVDTGGRLESPRGDRTGRRTDPPGERIRLTRSPEGNLEVLLFAAGDYRFQAADPVSGGSAYLASLPEPLEASGPWEVQFPPRWGAPERVTLDRLVSWSEHPDPGVRHFSGTATYTRTISIPSERISDTRRLFLDLGQVAVMAEVQLNGRDLGILWKPPFRVDVTEAVKAGENRLVVKVVNLWVNRQIGDEQLAEDSARNPDGTLKSWPHWLQEGQPSPTGRHTFTSWRLWRKDDALQESGLLGPVRLISAVTVGL